MVVTVALLKKSRRRDRKARGGGKKSEASQIEANRGFAGKKKGRGEKHKEFPGGKLLAPII